MSDHVKTRWRHLRRVDRVVLAAVVVAVSYLLYAQVQAQVNTNTAVEEKKVAEGDAEDARQDAESVADPLDAVCRNDEEVRRRLGDLCDRAAEVKDQPAPAQGARDGVDGRGITGTVIADGRLLITYTDGVVEDKGPVVGGDGKPGRGVSGSAITAAGRLVLSYSDGTTEDVGVVVGPEGKAGRDGENGVDGRGVLSVTVSPDFRLIVTYDDGTTADAGQLPSGPKGDPGRGIESVAFDFDTCQATVTYSDGTSEPAPMTGCEPEPDPSDPADPPGGLLPGG